MKSLINNRIVNVLNVSKIIIVLSLSLFSMSASAHVSPAGCTGSGLGINLFTSHAVANIGDTISYSVTVFNGLVGGSVVCDAANITASIVTPDGVNHPITLTRTSLSDGENDFYSNIVTYVARAQDITPQGTLTATASDTGTIHQNITDSSGGGNQGLNVFVLNTLRIIKLVENNNGSTGTAADFSVHVANDGVEVPGSPASGTGAPGTLYSLIAGTYTVSEAENPLYIESFSGDCDADGNVTLLGSDDKICTVTNTHIPPSTITVVKSVINDDGGTNTVGDFPLFVNAETGPGPTPAIVLLALGPFASSTSVVSGVVNTFPAPASYTISETINVNYAETFSGDCDLLGHLDLAPGENKTCTITNNDIPPLSASINVVKVVVNDNGGTKTIADFPLFVNGAPVASGVTNVFPSPASYTITETVDANYTRTFSGDCDANGMVNITPGDIKICVITNNDIIPIVVPPTPTPPTPPVTPPPTPPVTPPTPTPTPSSGGGGSTSVVPPLIDVVKVPNPLALPDGPGPVTYTYTLRNIGAVAVSDVTMVGDSCSPIRFVSGDIDNDARLDLHETWIYTCSTNLPVTHTNTVTATGWANNISAVDVASATVIVGVPQFPPLIHVTKVPNPLALPIGGGLVTYSNIVTNPGTVPLVNVRLNDDKCAPVNYISGDTDGDSNLDTSEAWLYSCTTNLGVTTTNTVIAEGDANGLTARDFAIATVVVAVPRLPNTGGFSPGLPNTGYPPRAANNSLLAGILLLLSSSLLMALRNRRA